MSCCGGNCGCGPGCKCGSSCAGSCNMYPDMERTSTESLVVGVAPQIKMSCCGGKCGCGAGCKCGSDCEGCPDMESTSTESLIVGDVPVKSYFEGSEMGVKAKTGSCKCGHNCTCDPCNCN